MPHHPAPLVLALSLLMVSQAFAQPVRVRDACWGDSWAFCDVLNLSRPFEYFPCGSGGHSGFNRTVVCNKICGTADPVLCKIVNRKGGGDAGCGVRLVTVYCGFTKRRR